MLPAQCVVFKITSRNQGSDLSSSTMRKIGKRLLAGGGGGLIRQWSTYPGGTLCAQEYADSPTGDFLIKQNSLNDVTSKEKGITFDLGPESA